MSEANPARGDVSVNLGQLGTVVCRPGFRALQAIDDPKRQGPLSAILQRLMVNASLGDVVTIIYETHLDAKPEKSFSYPEIADAVLEVGFDTLLMECAALVGSAWSTRRDNSADADEEDASGNGQRAENQKIDSPPGNTPLSS